MQTHIEVKLENMSLQRMASILNGSHYELGRLYSEVDTFYSWEACGENSGDPDSFSGHE